MYILTSYVTANTIPPLLSPGAGASGRAGAPVAAAASPGAAPPAPGGEGREELPEALPPLPRGADAGGGLQCQAGPLPRAHTGVSEWPL